MLDLDIVLNRT